MAEYRFDIRNIPVSYSAAFKWFLATLKTLANIFGFTMLTFETYADGFLQAQSAAVESCPRGMGDLAVHGCPDIELRDWQTCFLPAALP